MPDLSYSICNLFCYFRLNSCFQNFGVQRSEEIIIFLPFFWRLSVKECHSTGKLRAASAILDLYEAHLEKSNIPCIPVWFVRLSAKKWRSISWDAEHEKLL